MGKLINHQKAKAYLDSIGDPIIQALMEHAYSQIFVGTPTDFEGEFDLLFFFKILEAFLHDRQRLAQALTGAMDGHPLVAD
jgi:hypothetical protein